MKLPTLIEIIAKLIARAGWRYNRDFPWEMWEARPDEPITWLAPGKLYGVLQLALLENATFGLYFQLQRGSCK